MNQLVFIQNGRPVTDSLMVSEKFEKRHDNVLRDIEQLECSKEFSFLNFEESTYQMRGRVYRKVNMTRDGFTFLVMGYTGKEAARFKEDYIKAFNIMEDELNGKQSNPIKALMQATHNLLASQELIVDRLDNVEQKVDEQITLHSGEQRRLQKAIATKVYSLEQDEAVRPELFRQLHREIKDRWGVASYKDIKHYEFQGVLRYVDAWVPKKAS